MVDFSFEEKLWNSGLKFIAGVDEAGRGPLAGPVVAAAVILPAIFKLDGIDDSKKLTSKQRNLMFDEISRQAFAIGVGCIGHDVIDAINIYQATFRAMGQAITALPRRPDHLLIDGPKFIGTGIPFTTIIGGDAKSCSIAAASIIAKVTRDRLMDDLDRQYPEYGFAKHKGYGTRAHLDAIRKFGPSDIHRKSFRMPAKEG